MDQKSPGQFYSKSPESASIFRIEVQLCFKPVIEARLKQTWSILFEKVPKARPFSE